MKVSCTLEELVLFMGKVFNPEAVKHLRLEVDIQASELRSIVKIYPQGLPDSQYGLYDTVLEHISAGKIQALRAMRELTHCDLKTAKDFVEKWFPHAPMH